MSEDLDTIVNKWTQHNIENWKSQITRIIFPGEEKQIKDNLWDIVNKIQFLVSHYELLKTHCPEEYHKFTNFMEEGMSSGVENMFGYFFDVRSPWAP